MAIFHGHYKGILLTVRRAALISITGLIDERILNAEAQKTEEYVLFGSFDA